MNSAADERGWCPVEAIDVAWKLRRGIYREVDGAVRALKRVHRDVGMERLTAAVATAGELLGQAIRIVEPKDEEAMAAYRSRVPNGPSPQERARCELKLASKF